MKKLTFGFIALCLLSTGFAADQATIQLKGKVEAVSSIQIENAQNADVTIDILNGSTESLKAQEESNADAGYVVKGSSLNGGLKHENDKANYAYTLKYANTQLKLNSETTLKSVNGLSGKTKVDSDIDISFTAQPDAPSGNYSDTVTITIESN